MYASTLTAEERALEARRLALFRSCARKLSGHLSGSPEDTLKELAAYCSHNNVDEDRYGTGDFLNAFEAEVAALVGQPAAVFMPSGVMAQLIALRIWCDRSAVPHVLLHPSSHLLQNENEAYAKLHGLRATVVGEWHTPLTAADLAATDGKEKAAACITELPLRRAGGVLPSWDELSEFKAAAKARGLKLHLDGARLWESQPYYGRTHAEICAGFDSVYVSFYKGLGAITGAMLCGPVDFITESRVWLRRHGGNLHQLWPYAASARSGLERHLKSFPLWLERTRRLAAALTRAFGREQLVLAPPIPHSPMLHVHLNSTIEALTNARNGIAKNDGLWIAGAFFPSRLREGWNFFEVAVADAAEQVSDAEAVAAVGKLLS